MKYFEIREIIEERTGGQEGTENSGVNAAETLLPATWEPGKNVPFAAVLTKDEWREMKDRFDMGIELEPFTDLQMTKAEVNYDSLTGTFYIPDRKDPSVEGAGFAFALDEKGVVFIDDTGTAERIIRTISRTKRLHNPGLGRFMYAFLDQIVNNDLRLLEKYEDDLLQIEQQVDADQTGGTSLTSRANAIRSDVRKLLIHYDQLMDLSEELEENENGFFDQENLRYFRLFFSRVERLYASATSLRDYTMQIGDLSKAHLEQKQNHIMTLLTVVTTIFMPLTLITGWYGMNFRYMPELESQHAYPMVFGICILIIIGSLIFFKKKKWL